MTGCGGEWRSLPAPNHLAVASARDLDQVAKTDHQVFRGDNQGGSTITSTTSIIDSSAHHQLFSLLNDKLPGCRCAHIRSGIRLLHLGGTSSARCQSVSEPNLSNDEETSAILRGSALGQQAALLCPLDAQLLSLQCRVLWQTKNCKSYYYLYYNYQIISQNYSCYF